MKVRLQFFSCLLPWFLLLTSASVYSIDKSNLKNLKSGVLLVGVCKEIVDYGAMPPEQQKALRTKHGAVKYDSYIAAVAKQKVFCTVFKSQKKYMTFVRVNSGSSFLINRKGYIVTNNHVVTHFKNIVVYDGNSGSVKQKSATVIWKSKQYDLAILKVHNLSLSRTPLSLANSDVINSLINEDVWSLGFTGASTKTIAKLVSLEVKTDKGVIRSKPEKRYLGTKTPVTTIEHSAFIHFGNSGGPLVDHCGRVIGVNQGGPKKVTGIGWAIHINHLIKALKANNISFDLSGNSCSYYLENHSGGGNLIIFLVTGILFIVTFVAVWVYRQGKSRPAGLTGFVRREMSRYFKRDHELDNEGPEDKPRNKKESDNTTASDQDKLATAENIVEDKLLATLVGTCGMNGSTLEMRGDGEAILGRSDEADLHIASDSVGRLHVRLSWQESTKSIWIQDLNSTNGTFLADGQQLISEKKTGLQTGSEFYLAEPEYAFKILGALPGDSD